MNIANVDEDKATQNYRELLAAIETYCECIAVKMEMVSQFILGPLLAGQAEYGVSLISTDEDVATQTQAALHEVAHHELGHLLSYSTDPEYERREREAHSVASIIACELGISYTLCDVNELMTGEDLGVVAMKISKGIENIMKDGHNGSDVAVGYMVDFMGKFLDKLGLEPPHPLELWQHAKELLAEGWWVRSPF